MGLMRSRATLSAFVPAPADTGWLPGDDKEARPNGRAGQGFTDAGSAPILMKGTRSRRGADRFTVRYRAWLDKSELSAFSH